MGAAIIPDREHVVELSRAQVARLISWLQASNGSLTLGPRLSVNAVEGGGVLVRTEPYRATTVSRKPSLQEWLADRAAFYRSQM
jgi:hypothetical protein